MHNYLCTVVEKPNFLAVSTNAITIRGLTFSKLNEWFTCCLRGEDKMTELLREVKDLIVGC